MRGLFSLLGATVLGSIGWTMGKFIGIGTALVVSCVGSGLGLYWGRRLFDEWLG